MTSRDNQPILVEGGGWSLTLVVIALASVAVQMATGPLFIWLLPRQWLGIHVVLVGLGLIVWAISTRVRPVPTPIAAATLAISLWPVVQWLVFNSCLVAETCVF